MTNNTDIFDRLMGVIEDRQRNPPPNSYTSTLFAGGIEKIGGKVREEAEELVEAAGASREKESLSESGYQHVVHEAADLSYHMLVLLAHCRVSLEDVKRELGRRFGTSGLDERASRPENQG